MPASGGVDPHSNADAFAQDLDIRPAAKLAGVPGWRNAWWIPTPSGKDKGTGAYNRAGYANPEYDTAIDEAVSTVDDAQREMLEQAALEIAMNDVALIPMHVQFTIAAGRKGLDFTPRADESTFAMNARPTQ